MNKLCKYGILAAGAIGVIGFFLPLIAVTYEGISGELSTYSLVTGIDKLGDHFPGLANLEDAAAADAEAAVGEFNRKLEEVRIIFAAVYVPSVLLALFGLLGIGLGRFGRGFGAVSLVASLAALAIYALLLGVIGDSGSARANPGIGAHLVAASGGLGLVFALVALVKPDTGLRRKGTRFKATIASRPPQL